MRDRFNWFSRVQVTYLVGYVIFVESSIDFPQSRWTRCSCCCCGVCHSSERMTFSLISAMIGTPSHNQLTRWCNLLHLLASERPLFDHIIVAVEHEISHQRRLYLRWIHSSDICVRNQSTMASGAMKVPLSVHHSIVSGSN